MDFSKPNIIKAVIIGTAAMVALGMVAGKGPVWRAAAAAAAVLVATPAAASIASAA